MWVLIIVLWQFGAHPQVSAHQVASQKACLKLLTTFAAGETAINDQRPGWQRDEWNVNCELRAGKPRVRA